MAKLEEISELLVSEIRDFEEAVKRLEEIQRKKVSLDVTDLRETFDKHEKVFNNLKEESENHIKRLEKAIGKAKIYPTLAVVLFLFSIALNCVLAAFIVTN